MNEILWFKSKGFKYDLNKKKRLNVNIKNEKNDHTLKSNTMTWS